MELKFEWFVAWRHLYERHPRAGRLAHIFSAFAFTLAAVALGLMLKTKPLGPVQIIAGHRDWRQIFHIIVVVALELAVLTLVFGWFRRRLSMFSTISAYGVFLGTMALVIVLSVMNGFEGDLRRKILGSNAHVLVTKEDGAFTEWREVDKKLAGIPGILGYAPYVQSEVGVSANSNYAGAIIKGIDPNSVGRVTDLRANVESDEMLARLWPLREDGTPAPYENHGFTQPDAAPAPPDAAAGTPDAEQAEEEPPEVFDTPATLPVAPATSQPTSQPIVTTIRPRGSDPRTDPLDGMLLGAEMYRNLHLFPGQEVQVVSPLLQDTPGGQVPRTRRFRVAGKVISGMYEYDTRNVYVTMPALQRFLSLGDEVTGFEVKLADLDATGVAIERIQAALGPGYVVRDWKDLNRSLFSALKLEKIAMFLVLTIIILVASFSIVANLIMLVVEKAREIAILKSMGAADKGIQWIFMLEGVYLGALGTGFGILKGVGTCVFLQTFGLPLNSNVYYINSLPVEMDVLAIVFVSLAGLAISFIATIYPARVAARLLPVEGLRRD